MARYTGPKVRISRRLSTNIFENEKDGTGVMVWNRAKAN